MKKLYSFFSVAVMMIAFSVNSYGQANATASASATATIVTPISISKSTDMNFGNVAVHATNAGTVVLTPGGSRTATDGVTLPASAGSPAAASFNVAGVGSAAYSITLPTTHTITRSSGTETMTVTDFTSNPSVTGTLSAAGAQVLTVGATLNVTGGQVAGTYTSGTGFDVTVNYN